MSEDDLYRTSTQYKFWSFTPESLAALRVDTNVAAAERVKAAIARHRAARRAEGHGAGSNGADTSASASDTDTDVDCLTPEEELRLVQYYSYSTLQSSAAIASKGFNIPIRVQATAVQYLKRFYLTNSPMTYHPKHIVPTALYFATKTENHSISVSAFAELAGQSEEKILASECLMFQVLRFNLDVRHPHRGLRGAYIELLALAAGEGAVVPGTGKTRQELQEELRRLPLKAHEPPAEQSDDAVQKRIGNAYALASNILKDSALLTDAYFHYTPSQVMFASLYLADSVLFSWYLDSKFPSGTAVPDPKFLKITVTIKRCAELLRDGAKAADFQTDASRQELKRIGKKLHFCQNPEKKDLEGLNRAAKRDGQVEGALDERERKRRKLERERNEQEGHELFGGTLKKE
ncbi:hypothetical protein W97_05169 [Coniosporium apollinis CBS 100218]|uniref:RNA polymerase II holoenzyme cyclin-like subunit n=1 Tax=Coniosporium apollinis (strain CBS 100218) TaxID=1168221 RepID=R7YVJ7_CONA1|nr:uncharacterized protein W97_05169 [Coniosporium apollinis CBS 100218]EON65927.1 hypothetical protein W97_05169 [Coniosporium apollinis CBS 100218]